MDKRAVLAAVRALVETDAHAALVSQKRIESAATHEEARPENDKDTRALEQSYLARGLAVRVVELQNEVSRLATMRLSTFTVDDAIALSALVTVENDDGEPDHFFVAAGGAGRKVTVDGVRITVVTPSSPLGRALVGSRVDDDIRFRAAGRTRELSIVDVA